MIFLASLVLAGAIVYQSNDSAGALMIAAGCALALVRWLASKFGAKWLIE